MDMGLSLRKRRNEPLPNPATLAGPSDAAPLTTNDVLARFQTMYDTYRNDILRYCRYRLPTAQDAEDATQEIFLKTYRALPGWQDRGSEERAWLFSIAHNEVVDRYRAHARKPQTALDDALLLQDQSPSPEQWVVTSGDLDQALRLLGQLSDDQRRVMELRLVGLTGAEIAGVLGKPHATVRKLQERALHRLTELRLAQSVSGGKRL
jgi:RNA polymerase sigma-70 factor (ECF subfamily)